MRIFYLFFGFVLIGFLSYSCTNNDENLKKNIVGTFYYSTTEEEDDVIVTIEAKETFKASGRVEDVGILTISTFDESTGKISLKYDIFITGEYNIKNSYLVYDYDINSIKIEPKKDQSYTEVVIANYLFSMFEEHVIPAIKQELIENDESKIIELTERKLVVESGGEQFTYRRE